MNSTDYRTAATALSNSTADKLRSIVTELVLTRSIVQVENAMAMAVDRAGIVADVSITKADGRIIERAVLIPPGAVPHRWAREFCRRIERTRCTAVTVAWASSLRGFPVKLDTIESERAGDRWVRSEGIGVAA